MMKYKISILSIAMAAIVLVSMSAVATAAQPATVSSAKAPSVVYYSAIGAQKPYVFVQGANGDLYWSKAGGAWQDSGIAITSAPAAVVYDGGITVLYTVSGGALASSNLVLGLVWTTPITWPGNVAAGTGPTAIVSPSGTIWAFYVDSTTLNLMVDQSATTQQGSPTAIANLQGVVTATPAAVSPTSSGVIDVVVRGTGGAIYEKTMQTGSWSGWIPFHDGTIGYGATLVSTGGSNVALFVAGSDNSLYELTSSNYGVSTTWAANSHTGALKWTGLLGVLASQPSGVQNSASGTTYVEVLGGGGIWTWSSASSSYTGPVATP
jgi:hypothetical protein